MAKKNSKFEKMKASLSKKVDASFQKLSQGSFPTYLDLPKGCSRWKPKSGKHLIDIIPYEATDKRPDFDEENPFVRTIAPLELGKFRGRGIAIMMDGNQAFAVRLQ